MEDGKRKFYIVATPIGNLSDLSYRAKQVLDSVEVIVCEDTRQTKKLLDYYKIDRKHLVSYHQHSNEKKLAEIVALAKKTDLAYVSDAGTPGISDPGGKLVETLVDAYKENVEIVPVPGPAALIAALSVSGFPADNFYFAGFIPHKKGRQKFLGQLKDSENTVVFYESVHRITKLLDQMNKIMSDRQIVVARELTKKFETIYRGTAQEIKEKLLADKVKGEFVVVVREKS